MSSLDPIVPQQKLMALWPGRPVDQRGILRVLNEDGSLPPIFWIFNTPNEPKKLARVLGRDQPLIFSRSSHLIVQRNDDPAKIREILTDYLFQEIHLRFSGASFNMGTSCQGSGMLMLLSKRLQEVSINVENLCMISCSMPEIATNCPAFLIYGDQDKGHDPFQKDVAAANGRAKKAFLRYQRVVISASHGQYYSERTIEEIFAQFNEFRSPSLSDRGLSR